MSYNADLQKAEAGMDDISADGLMGSIPSLNIPGFSSSSSAQSGVQGGTITGGSLSDLSAGVSFGLPDWVLPAIAVGGVLLLIVIKKA